MQCVLSVCLSVCRPLQQGGAGLLLGALWAGNIDRHSVAARGCGRFAAVGPAGRKYRSTATAAGRPAARRTATNAGSVISSADVGFFI